MLQVTNLVKRFGDREVVSRDSHRHRAARRAQLHRRFDFRTAGDASDRRPGHCAATAGAWLIRRLAPRREVGGY